MSDSSQATIQAQKANTLDTETNRAVRPPVDVFEDATGITLQADIPGVSKDRLDVRIDSDTLTIIGDISIPMPDGMEPLYADVRATHYQCSYSLSREMDTEKVEANLRDGALTLRIPKREAHKSRKIEVNVD